MVPSVLKELAEEKIVFLSSAKTHNLPFDIKGIVRLVDKKGNTLGVVIDKAVLDDIEEDVLSQKKAFINTLEVSRKSGKVKSSSVKKKAGLL